MKRPDSLEIKYTAVVSYAAPLLRMSPPIIKRLLVLHDLPQLPDKKPCFPCVPTAINL